MSKFNWVSAIIAFFVTLIVSGAISWLIIYEAYSKKGLSITTPTIVAIIIVLILSFLVGWAFGYIFRTKDATEITL